MIKWPQKRKQKIFSIFLLSYIIILIIPITIGSIAYMKAEQVVKEQAMNSNRVMLEQVRQGIDSRVQEMKKLASQIILNNRIGKFTRFVAPIGEAERYEFIDILKDLSSYKNITPFINDFFIYFPASDVLLTSSAHFRPAVFYASQYSFEEIGYEKWHDEFLTRYYSGNFLKEKAIPAGDNSAPMLVYMQSLISTGSRQPLANIGILVDEQRVKSLLASLVEANYGMACITRGDGTVITATSVETAAGIAQHNGWNRTEEPAVKTVEDRNGVVSYLSSQETDWWYVTVLPWHILLEKVDYIRSITLWITLAGMGAGILAACLMAYRNYHPIKKVVDSIHAYMEENAPQPSNELKFIEEAVAAIVSKDRQLTARLKQQWPVLKANLLRKLLKGTAGSDHMEVDSLRLYRIDFPYNRFGVLLFHIDNFHGDNFAEHENEWLLIRFIITNVGEELANQHNRGYMVELEDDILALVVNLPDSLTSEEAKNEMHRIAQEVKEFLSKHYETSLTVCMGSVHEEIDGIRTSYQEAVKAFDYRIIHGSHSIICYDEINDDDQHYYYPTEMETQLMNYVKAGNEEGVMGLLSTMFEENFTKRNLPVRLVQCLFFDIMSTAIKTLSNINVDYKEVFGESFDPVGKLLSCRTVDEIYAALQEIFGKLCRYIDEHKKSHNHVLRERILQFFEEHFANENLSQVMAAEKLGISSPYLSFFFKEQFGEKMLDYVNKLRINKAKELLNQNSLTINEIAEKVGCSNDMALIRIFKRYEGMTPGQWRESRKDLA